MNLNFKHFGIHDPNLERYIRDHTSPVDPFMAGLFRETYVRIYHPRRTSDHFTGKLLEMISWMIRPDRILEIGTFSGYGTLSLAAGLSHTGELHTIEKNDELVDFAKKWIGQHPLKKQIHLHVGDALTIVPTFSESFDLIFIDGEKDEYPAYYQICLNQLRVGGFIIADNVLWSGKVLQETVDPNDRFTNGILEFNNLVQNDPRVENLLLPVFDGIMIIRKK